VLFVQLVLAVTSLPILLSWGLPISYMSIVGNILFIPFLITFITLGSTIFFLTLFNIPCQTLIYALDSFTQSWHRILSCGDNNWLICFHAPPLYLSIIILTLIFISLKITRVLFYRFTLFVFILVMSLFMIFITQKNNKNISKQIEKGLFLQTDQTGALTLIDNNFLVRKKSLASFIEFELKPYLIKNYGSAHLKELVLLKDNKIFYKIQDLLLIDEVTVFTSRS
jgi:hypothetical protein